MKAPLVKKWFHSREKDDESGTVVWQGQILEEPQPGTYQVQLYDWFVGEPTKQILVPFPDMLKWSFFDSHQDMKSEWEKIRDQQKK